MVPRIIQTFVVLAALAAAALVVGTSAAGERWDDTDITTGLWAAVYRGEANALLQMMRNTPNYREVVARARSKDGRGGLFWAYEYQKPQHAALLLEAGADPEAMDEGDQRPSNLFTGSPSELVQFELEVARARPQWRAALDEPLEEPTQKSAPAKEEEYEDDEDVEL